MRGGAGPPDADVTSPAVPLPADSRPALGPAALAAWALGAIALLVLLALWQRNGYWEYSDGVYALTARLVADGHGLYDEVAAAQPPPIYLFAAAVLTVSDTLTALRAALAAVELATSALVLLAVWRLTGLRAVAVVAGLLALVTPWALREHAQLLPETFAAPLLLAAALVGSRRAAVPAGALAAGAAAFKLAFALPALVVLLLGVAGDGRERVRALAGFVATGAALALLSLVLYGGDVVEGALTAQRESGLAALSYVGGLWAQGAWNLLPLLACAALAWPLRARIGEPDLLRALAAAALGALLLMATLFKSGSYLTVVVVAEPPLLCLAAAAVTAALRRDGAAVVPDAVARRAAAGGVSGGVTGARGAIAVAAVVALLQVGSLLATPGDPVLFTRPLAASGPERKLSPAQVDAAVAQLRACPTGVAASGPPYLAFVAGRPIAGDQPDQFILAHAPALGRFRAAAERDQPRCP